MAIKMLVGTGSTEMTDPIESRRVTDLTTIVADFETIEMDMAMVEQQMTVIDAWAMIDLDMEVLIIATGAHTTVPISNTTTTDRQTMIIAPINVPSKGHNLYSRGKMNMPTNI